MAAAPAAAFALSPLMFSVMALVSFRLIGRRDPGGAPPVARAYLFGHRARRRSGRIRSAAARVSAGQPLYCTMIFVKSYGFWVMFEQVPGAQASTAPAGHW